MPEVSRFFGIVIRMYFDDHNPPHFRARYSDTESLFAIDPIREMRGDLNRRAVSMVIEWTALHQHELMDNWERLHTDQPLLRIDPLR